MRAEGVTVVAVTAFGLSFIGGMQTGSGDEPSKRAAAPAAAPLELASADALPELAAAEQRAERRLLWRRA